MVTDPTYENFNYSHLLDQAVSPITALANGRLAVAQLKNQQAFETQRDANLAHLAASRETDRLQQEANIRESERQKIRNEGAAAVFARAKQISPDYSGPDPSKSIEDNVADATGVIHKSLLGNYKKAVQATSQTQSQYLDMFSKLAQQQPVDEGLLGRKLAADPDLTLMLTPAQKTALANGSLSPTDLINSLANNGRLVGGLEATLTGVNPRTLAQNLAQKYQDYKTAQQQIQQQAIGLKATAEGRLLESKLNSSQELANSIRAQIPGDEPGLADAITIPPSASPPSPSAPQNPNGLFPGLLGNNPAAPPPTAKPDQPDTPPGTPLVNDYRYNMLNKQISDNRTQADAVNSEIAHIDNTFQTGKLSFSAPPVGAFAAGGTTAAAMSPSALVNQSVPLTDDVGKVMAKRYQDLNKQKAKIDKDYEDLFNQKRDLEQKHGAFQPAASPQTPALGASIPPNPQAANSSGLPPTPQDTQPSGQSPSPLGTNAQAGQFSTMAARNQIFNVVGTSNPQALQKAAQFAEQNLGMSQQDLGNLLTAATKGDQTSISRIRQIVSQSQSGASGVPTPSVAPPISDPSDVTVPPVDNSSSSATNNF